MMAKSGESSSTGLAARSRAACIAIVMLSLAALGTGVGMGAPADGLSPRAARQLASLGFLLLCFGTACAIWLVSAYLTKTVAGGRIISSIRLAIEKFSKWPLALALLVLCIVLVYRPTLGFSFFGDDFYLLNVLSEGPLRVLLAIEEIYHYFPVTLLIIGIPRWLGIGEASTYRLINILMHSANAALLYLIASRLLRSRFHAYGAAAIFSFFFLTYDPVLWPLVGNHYVVSTFFALLSFLSFMRYRRLGVRRHLWGFVFFYVLSIYTHEIAVPLIGVCVFYDLTRDNNSRPHLSLKRLVPLSKAYVAPAAMLALLWSIKYFYTSRIVVSRNTPLKMLQNFTSAACFFSPFNNMNAYWLFSRWGQDTAFLILASAVTLVVLAVCFVKAGRGQRVGLVWGFLFILPAVSMTQLGPRYFYIPAVGWSVFWSGVIRTAATRIERWPLFESETASPELRAFLGFLAAGLLYGCIALQGYRHAAYLTEVWHQGSLIVGNTICSTAELINQHPDKKRVIVVDQPTWFQGDDFYGAPLLIGPIHLPLKALVNLNHPNVRSVRLHSANFFDESFPKVSHGDLEAAWDDGTTLVIQYDPRKQIMTLYEPPSK